MLAPDQDPIPDEQRLNFLKAAKEGKLAQLKSIYSEYPDLIDCASASTKNTALHYASDNGHADIVEFLLKHGASITKQNTDLQTAGALAKKQAIKKLFVTYQDQIADGAVGMLQSILGTMKKAQLPVAPPTDFLVFTIPVSRDMSLSMQKRNITRLKIYAQHVNPDMNDIDKFDGKDYRNYLIEVSFEGGSKEIYTLLNAPYPLLRLHAVTYWLYGYMEDYSIGIQAKPFPDQDWDNLKRYDSARTVVYQIIRSRLVRQFTSYVENIDPNQEIVIVEPGCGFAFMAKMFYDVAIALQRKVKAVIAFDTSAINLAQAKQVLERCPNAAVLQLDVENASQLFQKIQTDNVHIAAVCKAPQQYLIFVVACGLLNSRILDGQKAGANALHELFPYSDMLFVGGLTTSVIPAKIRKQVGFVTVNRENLFVARGDSKETLNSIWMGDEKATFRKDMPFTFFNLRKSTPEEREIYLLKRIEDTINTRHLILNNSATPLQDLMVIAERMPQKELVEKISLCNCRLISENVPHLLELLQNFPQCHKLVLASPDDKNYDALMKLKPAHLIIHFNPSQDQAHLPVVSTRMQRRLGH